MFDRAGVKNPVYFYAKMHSLELQIRIKENVYVGINQ